VEGGWYEWELVHGGLGSHADLVFFLFDPVYFQLLKPPQTPNARSGSPAWGTLLVLGEEGFAVSGSLARAHRLQHLPFPDARPSLVPFFTSVVSKVSFIKPTVLELGR
jgi:hypothetical protein